MRYPEFKMDILDELDLTDKEREFIEGANTAITANMNMSRIISEFYFAKTLRNATETMASMLPEEALRITGAVNKASKSLIESNERLAKSNDRYANRMLWLTIALLIAAFIEAVATLVSALIALGVIRS
jgi:hypothetical protein